MKRVYSILLAAVMLLSLTACGASGPQGSSAPVVSETPTTSSETTQALEDLKNEEGEIDLNYVGIVLPQLAAQYFIEAEKQLRSVLEAEGIKVETQASDNNQAQQLSNIENFAEMGIDGLIIFPCAGSEIAETLEELHDKGIRIVVMSTYVSGGYDAMILTNDADRGDAGAKMAAEWIDKTFPDAAPGSIEVGLLTVRVDPATVSIADGFKKVEEYTDKAKVVVEYDTTFADGAPKVQENAEMLIATYPNVKVIIAQIHSMAVDEVIQNATKIDKSQFAIFTDTVETPILERIQQSADDTSVIRGVGMVGPYGKVYHVAEAMLGRLELPDDKTYWNPVQGVTLENMSEVLGTAWDY